MSRSGELHIGHRERVKQRLQKVGMNAFYDHQLLELLLFYPIPRRDTNELAHRLVDHFGSLNGVMDAPYDELCACGLGPSTAVFIKMTQAVCQRYYEDKTGTGEQNRTTAENNVEQTVLNALADCAPTCLLVVLLNARGEMICREMMESAEPLFSAALLSRIVQSGVSHQAAGVLVAHRAGGASAEPTETDKQNTAVLKAALRRMGIFLMEHFIVAGDRLCALSEREDCEALFF